jgi:intracellular septation protein A
MDSNDWMAFKLVGLFGLILLAMVVLYYYLRLLD